MVQRYRAADVDFHDRGDLVAWSDYQELKEEYMRLEAELDALQAKAEAQEPVAWRWNYGGTTNWRLQEVEPREGDNKKCPRVIQALYAAPQPVAVPDMKFPHSWCDAEGTEVMSAEEVREAYQEACRAAPQPVAVPGPIKDHRLNSGPESDDYYVGYQSGWNACRAAMLELKK